MKKYSIIIIMSLIIVLIIILSIIIKHPSKPELSTSIYNREIKNYINNEYYSSTIEKYELSNGKYTFIKEINYKNKEKITNSYEGYYYEENGKILLDNNDTLYLIDDKLCLDKECKTSYSKNSTIINNKIENFKPESHLISLSTIDFDKIESNFKYIVITQTGCPHCEIYIKELLEVVKDYNIDIYILDMKKLSKESYNTIKEQYNIKETPTTIIISNNKQIDKFTGIIYASSINDILFKNKITER